MAGRTMPEFRPAGSALLEGFRRERMRTAGAEIHVAIGGSGPPLLLLHGNPLTHVSWHKVAPSLAESFTIVAPDLRGYGDSSKPPGGADHAAYSFRAMGEDNFAIMQALGFQHFQIAGHDRGARVAFRMALDQPARVARVALLDIVPTHHLLTHITLGWAVESYHWFFMAQPYPFPEKLLTADLDYYIQYKLNKKGVGLEIFAAEALAEYARCTTPEQIHAVCEDYRATLGIDLAMDAADYGQRRLACPTLVLWGSQSHVGRHYRPLEAWSEWAEDLVGLAIPTGHYPAEHRPDLVYPILWQFFSGERPTSTE
jgi:haloacetate dehalogenase